MIYLILTILVCVGIIGYLWVDNMCLKQQLMELDELNWELSAELDPIEVYNLRSTEDD